MPTHDTDGRWHVDTDAAIARLTVIDDYDSGDGVGRHVHTFRTSVIGLLGAHWRVERVEALIRERGAEEAGPSASRMGHTLVVRDDDGPLFLAARPADHQAPEEHDDAHA